MNTTISQINRRPSNLPKVKSNRPNRKLIRSNRASDVVLCVNDRMHKVSQLSEYSCEIDSNQDLKTGTTYNGTLLKDKVELFDVKFRTQSQDAGVLLCRFSDMSLHNKSRLANFAHNSKNSSGTPDVLNQLSYDQIAGGVTDVSNSTIPAENTVALAEKETGVNSGLRIVAALSLIAAIIGIVFVTFTFIKMRNQVDIYNAALVGNYLPIQSGADGLLTELPLREGQTVKAGDVLFTVQNKQIETEIAFANAELVEARASTSSIENVIQAYHGKLDLVAENLSQRILGAKAEIRKAVLESRTQKRLIEAKKALFNDGMISSTEFENSQTLGEIMRAEIDSKNAQLGILEVAYKGTTERGILSMGDVLDDQLGQLKADLAASKATVIRAEAQLLALSSNHEEIKAPTSGQIYAVYRQEGEFIKTADPVLSLSVDDRYWASGSVTAQEAPQIRPGQEVRVIIPSLDLEVIGEVVAIGHRAIYTQNGWSQDFRTAGLSVPVKVQLPNLPQNIPSGLRIKMIVKLGFNWPWEKETSGQLDAKQTTIVEAQYDTSESTIFDGDSVNYTAMLTQAAESRNDIPQSWSNKVAIDLSNRLKEIDGIEILQRPNERLLIRINDNMAFDTDNNNLNEKSRNSLNIIGQAFLSRPDTHVVINGHTDNVNVGANSKYISNYELSLARAKAVMTFLIRSANVPEYRLSATGWADSVPIANNQTPEGRKLNRRIEFVVTPRFESSE